MHYYKLLKLHVDYKLNLSHKLGNQVILYYKTLTMSLMKSIFFSFFLFFWGVRGWGGEGGVKAVPMRGGGVKTHCTVPMQAVERSI